MIALMILVMIAGDVKFETVINAFDTLERCERYKAVQPPLPASSRFECRREYVIKLGPGINDGR